MNEAQAKKKIQELKAKIHYYNEKYYQQSESLISDYTFDQMLLQLQQLEQKYPQYKTEDTPTGNVGEKWNQHTNSIYHKYPMLSLNNTYSEAEIIDFVERIKKLLPHEKNITFVCELKFDGVAVSMTYKDGILHHAVTRGDGEKGDDITAHMKMIHSIPLHITQKNIPSIMEVRGEVFMHKNTFNALNDQRKKNKENLWSNPRNTASGTLKMLDPQIVSQRSLDCYCYALSTSISYIKTHYEGIQQLDQWGFNISPTYKICKNIQEIMHYISLWEEKKDKLSMDIDGIVIKVNNIAQQKTLGLTSKSPRWAIAYKYTPEVITTCLEKVTYQIGRTGIITPVAHIKPVLLAGTVVKRASLYNKDYIQKLQLHLYDKVSIAKGGDIIPKIIAVDATYRSEEQRRVKFPTHCPACNMLLVQSESEKSIFCVNSRHCIPQLKGKLMHFAHRKAMNIGELGTKTIDLLFKYKRIATPADLYTLRFQDIYGLDGFKKLSTENLLRGIIQSKAVPFKHVLFALGIRYVGITAAEKLAIHFQDIVNLMHASLEDLMAVPEVGEKIAQSVQHFFQQKENQILIEQLQAAGVQCKIHKQVVLKDRLHLAQKKFVISGIFEKYDREKIKKIISDAGGKVVNTITTKVDYLLIGNKPGSQKLQLAHKHNITILQEKGFKKLLEQ